MGDDRDRDLDLALAAEAVRRASLLCRAVHELPPLVLEGEGSAAKADRSPVTIADYAAQALVCRILTRGRAGGGGAANGGNGGPPIVAEEGSADLEGAEADPARAAILDRVVQLLRAHAPEGAAPASIDGAVARAWIDLGAADPPPAGGGPFWTLDPIDGTKGFLRREQYAISLALIEDGRVELAALGCPGMNALFLAARGRGAVARELTREPIPRVDAASILRVGTRIHVSNISDPAAAALCESVESGHTRHDEASRIAEALGIVRPGVRMDSQAKYAAVARGDADVYLRLPTRADYREKIWDHAAGALVAREAGGEVTDVEGRPLDFTRGRALEANRGVVVTNGRLHDRVIEATRAVLGG